nr:MAG TPA: hypothetical protein [Bacteriophage sp.]
MNVYGTPYRFIFVSISFPLTSKFYDDTGQL